jgi:hypothetical protein
MRGLKQSRPVLAAAPGAALAVPFTTRMQVGLVAQQKRGLSGPPRVLCHHRCAAFPCCTAGPVPRGLYLLGNSFFSLATVLAENLGRSVMFHARCANALLTACALLMCAALSAASRQGQPAGQRRGVPGVVPCQRSLHRLAVLLAPQRLRRWRRQQPLLVPHGRLFACSRSYFVWSKGVRSPADCAEPLVNWTACLRRYINS